MSVCIDKLNILTYTAMVFLLHMKKSTHLNNETDHRGIIMSNPEQLVATALKSIEKDGFTDAVVTSLKKLIVELDEIIQCGESEYGGSTVSSSESRRYEQALISRRLLVSSLKQRQTAETVSIIHAIIDQRDTGVPADTALASAAA